MDDQIRDRLSKIEWQMDTHDKQFDKINDTLHKISNAVQTQSTLSKDVGYLDERLDKLDSGQEKLTAKMDEQIAASSRVPWGQWIAFGSFGLVLLSSLGGFFLNGITGQIGRVDKEITQIQSLLVPRSEIDERRRALTSTDEDLRKRIERLESKAPF